MGHLATALVPYSRVRGAPLLLLLFCAQLPDLFWLALALFGLEAPEPSNALDVTMTGLHVDMIYSHSGAGALALAVATGLVVWLGSRRADLAAWCSVLVAGHWVSDLLCGWEHEVFVRGTPRVGLGLYSANPYAAFGIEAVFGAALVWFYARSEASRGRPLSPRSLSLTLCVFVLGALVFVPNSYVSLRSLLG